MIDIPYEQRFNFSKDNIKPGSILKLRSPQADPPKIKYHIIISVTDGKAYYVFTNSQLRDYQKNNPVLAQLQVEIPKDSEASFPDRCFIDCARVQVRDIDDLAHEMAKDMKVHQGWISEPLKERLKEAAQKDQTRLSPIEKHYFENL